MAEVIFFVFFKYSCLKTLISSFLVASTCRPFFLSDEGKGEREEDEEMMIIIYLLGSLKGVSH